MTRILTDDATGAQIHVLSLGEICDALGFKVPADLIEVTLGIERAGNDGRAILWRADHLDRIRAAIAWKMQEPVKRFDRKVRIEYLNHRSETEERDITPWFTWYGTTQWHPQPQHFLEAFCHSRQAQRSFALTSISFLV